MPAQCRDENGGLRDMTVEEMCQDGLNRLDQIRVAIANARSSISPSPARQPPVVRPPQFPYTTIVSPADDIGYENQLTMDAFAYLGLPSDEYHLVYVKPTNSEALPYGNFVHKDGTVIICAWNFRKDDTALTPMKWSDLLVASCVATVTLPNKPASMSRCVAIWRLNIVNQQTQMLISRLQEQNGNSLRSFEIGEEDPLFFALVASDNGRAIASMLRDYPWLFDFKTITSAYVVLSDPFPCLY